MESEDELKQKLLTWKSALESKNLKVNVKRNKSCLEESAKRMQWNVLKIHVKIN